MSKAFNRSRADLAKHVIIPTVMPFAFAAGRVSFADSWKLAALVETFGGSSGVGYQIGRSYHLFSVRDVLAWMCFFVIFVVLLERLVLVNAERRLFRWRAETPQRGRRWLGGRGAATTDTPDSKSANDVVRDAAESAVESVDSGAGGATAKGAAREHGDGHVRAERGTGLTSDPAARYTARLLALALWQAVGLLSTRIPTPIGTIEFLVDEAMRGELWVHLTWTLRRAVFALSAVLVLGVAIGWAMGRRRRRVGAYFRDVVTIMPALPAFIWALLAAMWWAFSEVGPFVVPALAATPMPATSTFEGASCCRNRSSRCPRHTGSRRAAFRLARPSGDGAVHLRGLPVRGAGRLCACRWSSSSRATGARAIGPHSGTTQAISTA